MLGDQKLSCYGRDECVLGNEIFSMTYRLGTYTVGICYGVPCCSRFWFLVLLCCCLFGEVWRARLIFGTLYTLLGESEFGEYGCRSR